MSDRLPDSIPDRLGLPPRSHGGRTTRPRRPRSGPQADRATDERDFRRARAERDAAPGLERRLAGRPPGRHRSRRHPLHAPDRRRRSALRPVTRRASRQRRRARTSRPRRGRRRRAEYTFRTSTQIETAAPDARLAEQRRLHQRRRPPARRCHLRDLPWSDNWRSKCSFFVKNACQSPTRATS